MYIENVSMHNILWIYMLHTNLVKVYAYYIGNQFWYRKFFEFQQAGYVCRYENLFCVRDETFTSVCH